MRKHILLSTLVLIATFLGKVSNAQDFSNKGKEFWFCFPNHIPSGNNPGSMSIWITSDQASSGTITMTNGAFTANWSVAANGITSVNIPHNLAHISNAESNTVIQKSLKLSVNAGQPDVVAYAQQYGNARSAATLLLPTNVLGKKYRAFSFTHTATSGGGQNSRSQFQVIATRPNTQVSVTPYSNGVAGTPITINLPAVGDMYQYQAASDVTGTLIESVASGSSGCQPIAVFSGNSAVTFGVTTTSGPTCTSNSYDPLFQQMYPVSTWGKNYGFIPFGDYTNGNPYRVMAAEDNTTISINGTVVATINAGEIYPNNYGSTTPEVLALPTSISADKPICVAQYAQVRDCSGTTNGDPDMVILNPIEQNIKDITVFASTQQNISRQWINVLIPTIAAPSFRIDGLAPTTPFQPAANIPGYSYLQHMFNPAISGSHFLSADSGFNAIMYGFQQGQYESYAYSAGSNVKDLNQVLEISNEYGIETSPNVCIGSPFKFKVYFSNATGGTTPQLIRYDSMRWSCSNNSILIPANFPAMVYGTPTITPDSINVRNGKDVAWYSLPSNYTINTPGTYTITLTVYRTSNEGCGNEQEYTFPLTVTGPPDATFTTDPIQCFAEAVQFTETTEQAPKPTYRFWWNFGDPASGANNISLVRNPTHTFTAPGNYTVRFANITTPGCLSDTSETVITIPDLPTAAITGATTFCVNDPNPHQITFTAAEGAPLYEFSYTIDNGSGPGPVQTVLSTAASPTTATVNIPTGTPGTFRYSLVSVRNVGAAVCVRNYTNTFVDVVINDNTILNLASGSNTQSVCQNVAIGNIGYTITGGGNNATATGLPPGVTGVYNAGTFTISGTPTTPGTYNYTVDATGLCLPASLTGTITVNPDAAIALNSANNTQTLCINTPVSQVIYSVSGGGTGATVTGLPPGVTGSYSGGVFTISGSPTAAGTFNYTVNTTGTCVQTSATGTITVTPDATLNLTSGAGTDFQTVCINRPIATISYQWGASATGFVPTGLPTGITATHIGGGVVQITGTPTVQGSFSYSITTTGPCINPTMNGLIVVTDESTVNLVSAPATTNQELCVGVPITNIGYVPAGSTTGLTFTGLPPGVTSSFSGGIFTISGTPTVPGTYNYTVTPTGPCTEGDQETGTLLIHPRPTPAFTITTPSCATRDIQFMDNSAPNVGALTNWQWDFGVTPTATSNLQNPVHIYNTPGTYTVSLTVTNDEGCANAVPFTQNITINPRPRAGFIVPEVCINDVATVFTDTSRVVGDTFDPTGYHWNFGDPPSGALNTATTMNGSHLYTAIGPYNVTHVVTTMSGCKDTVTNQIFINAADPVSDFNITSLATLCSNDSISLVNRSTISQGNVTKLEIYWDVVGAPATFETIDVPVFNGVIKHKYPTLQTTQTYTIRMVAYSGAICFTSRTQTITVNAAPRATFAAVPAVCWDAAPFSLVPFVGDGGVAGTRTFSGPGVNAAGMFNPSLVAPGGTYTIKYLHTSTAAGCVDSATQDITVYDTASARITFDPVRCEQQAVSFNSNTSSIPAGAGSIVGWNWNFGDPGSGANNTSTAAAPTHTFNAWGTYNVTLSVVSSNGCRSTVRTEAVRVSPKPVPAFTIPASLCLPSATAAFTNNTVLPDDGSGATLNYVWDFGDPGSGPLNTSTGTSPSHIYNGVGPYTVTLQATSTAGCIATTTMLLNTIHPQPEADFTVNPPEVCIGDDMTFTDNTDYKDGTRVSINWDLKDGNTRTVPSFTYTYGTAGTFNVELYAINSHGCRSTLHTEPVTVHPYPVVDAGPDRLVLEGGQITLEPVVTGNDLNYVWTPNNSYIVGSNTVKNLVVKGVDDIRYLLTVTARGGCSDTSSVFIKVLKFPSIPNIFSPNGDGVHDRWVIDYLDTYPGSVVEIYNRYGQMIFRSEGYRTPWDGTVNGKPVPVGTYYYIVNPKNGRPVMTGYVDVIR